MSREDYGEFDIFWASTEYLVRRLRLIACEKRGSMKLRNRGERIPGVYNAYMRRSSTYLNIKEMVIL